MLSEQLQRREGRTGLSFSGALPDRMTEKLPPGENLGLSGWKCCLSEEDMWQGQLNFIMYIFPA